MSTLIARVRLMIADPAGASQQFADQDIQDVLDESRVTVRQAILRHEGTINPGGDIALGTRRSATLPYAPSASDI